MPEIRCPCHPPQIFTDEVKFERHWSDAHSGPGNYYVHNGSSGYCYYVACERGQYVAAALRQEVSDAIAAFLNTLPEGISAEEVLNAIGLGRPHGALEFSAEWKRGQTWPEDPSLLPPDSSDAPQEA